MKAILLSAPPLQIEELQKTGKIKVGKKPPKETPFKVYIYCRKSNDFLLDIDPNNGNSLFFCWEKKGYPYPFKYEKTEEIFNGHIVAEFICEKTDNSILYSSDFKIYDFRKEAPKSLFEFKRPCSNTDCEKCLGKPYKLDAESMRVKIICPKKVIHAPKVWCYVEKKKR